MNQHDQENNFNSVRHVRIMSEKPIDNCIYHFSNATELTLQNNSSGRSDWLIITLKQMIFLQNLSKLEITSLNYSFEKLIELLLLTPNIVTLKINCIMLDAKDINTFENNETFQTVSNMNIIKNVTVTQIIRLEEVELLLILCSRMEHFAIERCHNRAASIVQLVSSKNNDIAQHLISFHILINDQSYLNRLDILQRANKLLNDCIIKLVSNQLYLWR